MVIRSPTFAARLFDAAPDLLDLREDLLRFGAAGRVVGQRFEIVAAAAMSPRLRPALPYALRCDKQRPRRWVEYTCLLAGGARSAHHRTWQMTVFPRVLLVDPRCSATGTLLSSALESHSVDFGVVGDGSALLASAVAHYAVIVVIAIAREDLAFLEDFRSRSGKPIVIVLTPRDSVSLRLDPDLVHASLREPIDVPTVAEIIAATVKLIRPWLTRSTPDDGTSARLRDE